MTTDIPDTLVSRGSLESLLTTVSELDNRRDSDRQLFSYSCRRKECPNNTSVLFTHFRKTLVVPELVTLCHNKVNLR